MVLQAPRLHHLSTPLQVTLNRTREPIHVAGLEATTKAAARNPFDHDGMEVDIIFDADSFMQVEMAHVMPATSTAIWEREPTKSAADLAQSRVNGRPVHAGGLGFNKPLACNATDDADTAGVHPE